MAQGQCEERRLMVAQGRRGACTVMSWLGGRRGVRGRVALGERTGMVVRQGRPRMHGAADQRRPRCAGPAGSRRGLRATPARRRALDAKGQKPFRLAPFERVFSKFSN
jgi:hypothetical protein